MSHGAWMSSVLSNQSIGFRLGTRTKHFGRDWNAASEIQPVATEGELQAMQISTHGYSLPRESFPEADAVFDKNVFAQVGELFASAGFFVVRGRLAQVFADFDLGEGGLIPFPVYEADLVTPLDEAFFLLNFGARKNSFLPEMSEDAQVFSVVKSTGVTTWDVNYLNEEGKVALSPAALDGADLWIEEAVYHKIFMSDALARAINDIGLGEVFKLKQCKIVERAR